MLAAGAGKKEQYLYFRACGENAPGLPILSTPPPLATSYRGLEGEGKRSSTARLQCWKRTLWFCRCPQLQPGRIGLASFCRVTLHPFGVARKLSSPGAPVRMWAALVLVTF